MIKIVFQREKNRSVALDNDIEVGECTFTQDGKNWDINHTGVIEAYRGQGIARKLVECIIEEAKKNDKRLIADCSYAAKVIKNI